MLKPTSTEIVIEADTGTGCNPMFPPAGIKLRGKLEVNRVKDALARSPHDSPFADRTFPGERLHFDPATRKAFIEETLHDDSFGVERAALRGRFKIADIRRDLSGEHDLSTWLFWMKRLVDCGFARLVHGTFPVELPGKPRMYFFGEEIAVEKQTQHIEELQALVRKQSEQIDKLLSKLK